jgi:hypothetical protein
LATRQDGSDAVDEAHCDLKKASARADRKPFFVSIRKSEVAEIARVGGIFNRGVSIRGIRDS